MSTFASPGVRAQARREGIDLSAVADASGRKTLTRDDLEAGGTAAPTPHDADFRRYWRIDHSQWGPVAHQPLSRPQRAAAANLAAANALIPQVTNHGRADMRRIEAFRASLQGEAEARGVRLTALAFFIKALARCLAEFPRFNASLAADGETLVLKRYVHVGIAVDAPYGLVVPALRDADRKGVWRIAADLADLAARARERKLKTEDSGGASMSISNLGALRSGTFTPLVNPPEVAILGVSRAETSPVWEDGAWLPVPMTPLSLSWDHRVIDGAEAARFLTRFERLISDPRRLVA